MNTRDAISWFKQTFFKKLEAATKNTPYNTDLLCAIAYQETGSIWSNMIGKLTLGEIAMLAVGDTLDAPNRNAFPRNKQDLLSAKRGDQMFVIARECLVNMSKYVKGYAGAVANPNKFCHGYGIFQYDLQFFKEDPDYFLQKKWGDIDATIAHCIKELDNAKARQGWKSKTSLTDDEKVYVTIAYNKGSANLSKGFRQGFFNKESGKFYGEYVHEYLQIAKSITVTAGVVENITPVSIPLPSPVLSDKKIYRVKVNGNTLRLRSEPKIPKDNPQSNIKASLPNGQLVSWLSGKVSDPWYEVETSFHGAYFKGFVSSQYLELVKDNTVTIPVIIPAVVNPTSGIVAVWMPAKQGMITKRTAPANASSLNEPGQPTRVITNDPAGLKKSLLDIINWLNVDKPLNKRYQPGNGSTFCNIYAHDYCHLAGAYFPRVWWTPGAIAKLAKNEIVAPLYDNTIEEMRANNLLRWLKDFGERFGWRQTGNLNSLQGVANSGGIGLIIARRVEEGRSGHVTAVVPESELGSARRDANGNVVSPLQSQAGATNFKFGNPKAGWWLDPKFAEFAFWIHA